MPLPAAAARLNDLAQTRERIVDAARDTVAEDGWQGAQIALIASRADVATGSIYRYFHSKADLYTQVLAVVSQREVEVIQAIVDGEGSAAQRLERVIHAFVRRAMKGRRLAYALIAEPCERKIDAARLQYRSAIASQIARLIRTGIAAGEFAEVDENVAASCVTGAFIEALVGLLAPDATPDPASADRVASTIAQLCVHMVLKPSRPLRVVPEAR
jgi:AcrR family transcriptional regulator